MAPDSGKGGHGKLVFVHASVHVIDPEDLALLSVACCPSSWSVDAEGRDGVDDYVNDGVGDRSVGAEGRDGVND